MPPCLTVWVPVIALLTLLLLLLRVLGQRAKACLHLPSHLLLLLLLWWLHQMKNRQAELCGSCSRAAAKSRSMWNASMRC